MIHLKKTLSGHGRFGLLAAAFALCVGGLPAAFAQSLRSRALDVGQRVRDVRQGPDGFLYLVTDESDGRLARVLPR